MERRALYSDSPESEDLTLENYNVRRILSQGSASLSYPDSSGYQVNSSFWIICLARINFDDWLRLWFRPRSNNLVLKILKIFAQQLVTRLANISTETEDTSDGSDEENRVTRLEADKRKDFQPGAPQQHNDITHGTTEGQTDVAQVHAYKDTKASPKANLCNTKQTCEDSARGKSGGSSAAPAYSPEEENELFSSEYVDKLVASFWSKVDQKIETAVSQYQSNPQGGQQTTTQDSAQTTTEDKPGDESCSLSKSPGGVCVFILFIFQFIKKIFDLCKDKIKSKGKEWFTDGMWREHLKAIITHRHTNFTVVMVTIMDCFLVVANILVDFGVIDDYGIEFIFTGFLFINLTVMFLFLFECFLRLIVLQRDLFKDKMEGFDVALMGFYFLVEVISSHRFSYVSKPYPKYLHMIVILRCWRMVVVLEQLQEEKEAELSTMESQPPR